MTFLIETLRLGWGNLLRHKLRSLLTMLGIIIGVGAVVAIAAYGEGVKQAALSDILQLGSHNIIIKSVKPPAPDTAGSQSIMVAYGLTRADAQRVAALPGVEQIVPLKKVAEKVYHLEHSITAPVYGTTPDLPAAASLRVARGRYLAATDDDNKSVIGAEVAAKLFPLEDPLGREIRVDDYVFTVVGVLREVGVAGGAGAALVGRDLNFDVHIPIAVARTLFGDDRREFGQGSITLESVQITEMIVRAGEDADVRDVAAAAERAVEKDHPAMADISVIVPLELLEQAERTEFRSMLASIIIGALSLGVGGIGIMNIMLASVTERTREIGIRRALGATRAHIVWQFLVETAVLSCLGGVVGIGLGLGAAGVMTLLAGRFEGLEPAVVTPAWPTIAFAVAVAVGVLFGLYPAIKASQQDPMVALRHE